MKLLTLELRYSKTCLKRTPHIYRKPGQTENKFRNKVIPHVKIILPNAEME
jgi:hypothetical protein